MIFGVSRTIQNGIIISTCLLSLYAFGQGNFLAHEPLNNDVSAFYKGGAQIGVLCTAPSQGSAQDFFQKYLADGISWQTYANKGTVAIPFHQLQGDVQRQILLQLFPLDYVDKQGWWHTVRFASLPNGESIEALTEWLTGSAKHCAKVLSQPENRGLSKALNRSDHLFVPQSLLLPIMQKEHARRPLPVIPAPSTAQKASIKTSSGAPILPASSDATPGIAFPFVNGNTDELLSYEGGLDGQGVYYLRQGESLYSAVVVRFTDYRENKDILEACDIIAKKSGIADVHTMKAGQKILIPVEMLSDRYKPAQSEGRRRYESVRQEERRFQADRVYSKDLQGVVVVLDPGHGGRDRGAAVESLSLFEDEINYDIVCRIKAILESETQATVYVTVLDPTQGYKPTDATKFRHDTQERLTTTPHYENKDSDVSVILRYYLANDIYFKERKKGVDDRKIIFASIHCDSVFNETLRGAMVYVPGAQYRKDPVSSTANKYQHYEEVKRNPTPTTTAEQRKRDEALSRVFANTLLNSMRGHNPPLKVHDAGDPIRNVIRRGKTQVFLPGVLRYNVIPTKVLIEIANMQHPKDQAHLANPKWRQWFAEAFVDSLRQHYYH